MLRRSVVVAIVACGGSALLGNTGCTRTFAAVNPRPSVVIDPQMGALSLELGQIPDTQTPGDAGLTITNFRTSLANGFRNMAGANYSAQAKEAKLVLHIEQAELGRGNIGSLGAFLTIRYRALWSDSAGNKVAAMAGVAQPRNPTETGPRHIEDVIEVMYEEMVAGLEKVQGVKTRTD
ncbi:MAG TPA: hypothetical protein VHM25_15345 [Polyangiaceae bacterium]|nr:hypothetical protein [Polyangiaceae bacterium]